MQFGWQGNPMIASCGATCDKESLRYNKNFFYEHKQILYTCDQLFCRMLFLTFIIKCIMYKALKWMWKLHYKHQIPSLPNITQFLPLKKISFLPLLACLCYIFLHLWEWSYPTFFFSHWEVQQAHRYALCAKKTKCSRVCWYLLSC